MQLHNQSFADQLKAKVVEAIWTPTAWGAVLDSIIESTPACAAIITLRDKKTCQIVNDVDLEASYHSPLVRGFEEEAVIYYLSDLREIDPWAKCQRIHYPFRPTLMSAVKAPETEPDNRFYQWLNGLGMYDSVVFELDRMAGYWSACNLFLPNRDVESARELMSFVTQNYEFLAKAWKTSQRYEQNSQTAKVLMDHLGENGQACCIAGPNGEIVSTNSAFDTLLAGQYVRLSGPNKKISFSHDVIIDGLENWEDHRLTRYDHSSGPIHVSAKPIDPDRRFLGKREKFWVLIFSDTSEPNAQNVLSSKKPTSQWLNEQETQLYNAILAGKSVVEAGKAIGVKRSRTYEIWQSVKSKLRIASAHQLRHSIES